MTIGVGIIGYGYWGQNLLRNFAQSSRFNVVAVADPRSEARERAFVTVPGLSCCGDAAELFRRNDVDAVVIATPVSTHFSLARAAMLAGKHVLVEKPLCRSVAEGEELLALAARAGRVLMVDHTYLCTGAVETIKRTVDEGRLGKICYFDSVRVNLGLFQHDVNCLWDLAPHDLSIIDFLIDDEVIDIDVTGYGHLAPDLPDMIYMTLHYARNAMAHFNLSWMSPMKVRRLLIGGTQQMLMWDDLDHDQKVRIYDCGIAVRPEAERASLIPDYRLGDIHSPRVARREALSGVVEHFAGVIAGQETPLMGAVQGLKVVKVLERAQNALDRSLARVAAARAGR